jgi:carboxyl-terminal processing protease
MKTSHILPLFALFLTLSVPARLEAAEAYDRSDANAYATRVLAAADIVGDEYIEKIPVSKLVAHAIRGLYDGLPAKLPRDLEDRLNNVEKENDLKKLIADARFHLGKNQALDERRDLSLAVNAMLRRLDPYCSFEPAPRFIGHPDWPQVGVGLQLGMAVADGAEVITPTFGSPAHRAGIRARDVVTSVMSLDSEAGMPIEKPELISLKGKTPEQAARLLVGKAGSSVRVTVRRPGEDKLFTLDLVRAPVKSETVLGVRRRADGTWDYWLDADQKTGYIRISQIGEQTATELSSVLRNLQRKGAKGLVLDLRFCPGGLLNATVKIAEIFVGAQIVVSAKTRAGEPKPFRGEREAICPDLSLVCLVNEESKRSAEILAACLQDHHRAVILGARTFGNGSIQSILAFEVGHVKLTTATFQRPSGPTLHRIGVTPAKDATIELKEEERANLRAHLRSQEAIPAPKEVKFPDRQLEGALEMLKKARKK